MRTWPVAARNAHRDERLAADVASAIHAEALARAGAGDEARIRAMLRAHGRVRGAWRSDVCTAAAAGGHLGVLVALRERELVEERCPWDVSTCRAALRFPPVLRAIRDPAEFPHGVCPWDSSVAVAAALEVGSECVRGLAVAGCPLSTALVSAVLRAASEAPEPAADAHEKSALLLSDLLKVERVPLTGQHVVDMAGVGLVRHLDVVADLPRERTGGVCLLTARRAEIAQAAASSGHLNVLDWLAEWEERDPSARRFAHTPRFPWLESVVEAAYKAKQEAVVRALMDARQRWSVSDCSHGSFVRRLLCALLVRFGPLPGTWPEEGDRAPERGEQARRKESGEGHSVLGARRASDRSCYNLVRGGEGGGGGGKEARRHAGEDGRDEGTGEGEARSKASQKRKRRRRHCDRVSGDPFREFRRCSAVALAVVGATPSASEAPLHAVDDALHELAAVAARSHPPPSRDIRAERRDFLAALAGLGLREDDPFLVSKAEELAEKHFGKRRKRFVTLSDAVRGGKHRVAAELYAELVGDERWRNQGGEAEEAEAGGDGNKSRRRTRSKRKPRRRRRALTKATAKSAEAALAAVLRRRAEEGARAPGWLVRMKFDMLGRWTAGGVVSGAEAVAASFGWLSARDIVLLRRGEGGAGSATRLLEGGARALAGARPQPLRRLLVAWRAAGASGCVDKLELCERWMGAPGDESWGLSGSGGAGDREGGLSGARERQSEKGVRAQAGLLAALEAACEHNRVEAVLWIVQRLNFRPPAPSDAALLACLRKALAQDGQSCAVALCSAPELWKRVSRAAGSPEFEAAARSPAPLLALWSIYRSVPRRTRERVASVGFAAAVLEANAPEAAAFVARERRMESGSMASLREEEAERRRGGGSPSVATKERSDDTSAVGEEEGAREEGEEEEKKKEKEREEEEERLGLAIARCIRTQRLGALGAALSPSGLACLAVHKALVGAIRIARERVGPPSLSRCFESRDADKLLRRIAREHEKEHAARLGARSDALHGSGACAIA